MNQERRVFERETVRIPFVYSLDEGNTLLEGVWKEARRRKISDLYW